MMIYFLISLACLCILAITVMVGADDHSALGEHDHDIASYFSLTAILMFGVGFGAAGAVAKGYGFDTNLAILAGLGFGLLISLGGVQFMALLKKNETDSTPSMHGLVGLSGKTRGVILPGSYGEIVLLHMGQTRTFRATASVMIPHNHLVRIASTDGFDVHVIPL